MKLRSLLFFVFVVISFSSFVLCDDDDDDDDIHNDATIFPSAEYPLGTKVFKEFPCGWYVGTISYHNIQEDTYKVIYDDDFDTEDYSGNSVELAEMVQNAESYEPYEKGQPVVQPLNGGTTIRMGYIQNCTDFVYIIAWEDGQVEKFTSIAEVDKMVEAAIMSMGGGNGDDDENTPTSSSSSSPPEESETLPFVDTSTKNSLATGMVIGLVVVGVVGVGVATIRSLRHNASVRQLQQQQLQLQDLDLQEDGIDDDSDYKDSLELPQMD